MITTTNRIRASAVCVHNGQLLTVQLKDPITGLVRPFPPGGELEVNEQPIQTAVRETLEETGYSIQAFPNTEVLLQYPFRWADKLYNCATYFYFANLLNETPAALAPDANRTAVTWLSLESLYVEMSYNPFIRAATFDTLQKHAHFQIDSARK